MRYFVGIVVALLFWFCLPPISDDFEGGMSEVLIRIRISIVVLAHTFHGNSYNTRLHMVVCVHAVRVEYVFVV